MSGRRAGETGQVSVSQEGCRIQWPTGGEFQLAPSGASVDGVTIWEWGHDQRSLWPMT
jgi:hypothetical protein